MATLEIQRPRMRYRNNADKASESRNDADYNYYSYKCIGVKPTSYSPFEANAAGTSNLLRSLTMVCDMCIVDLAGDVIGSDSGTQNLGNRKSFIFGEQPSASPDSEDGKEDAEATAKGAAKNKAELDDAKTKSKSNGDDVKQQGSGDMPGKESPDAPNNESKSGVNPGTEQTQDTTQSGNEEKDGAKMDGKTDGKNDPNGDLNKKEGQKEG